MKNDTAKIFMTPGGLANAKHLLINGKFYQTIGVVNLSEIENLDEIRKSSRWVNAEFQSQGGNREAKHFTYNFMTKNTGEELNSSIRLIEDKNRNIEFQTREKKNSISRIYDQIFSRTRKQHIKEVLIKLKKDFGNFQLSIQKKDITIQEYVRILKLTKQEYQKFFQENKLLKEKINSAEN